MMETEVAKYHVNHKGEPGPCSATLKCPFGGDDVHFNSIEEARNGHEKQNEKKLFKTVNNYREFKCYHCGNFVSKAIANLIKEGKDAKCSKCNFSLDLSVVIVQPNKNSSTYPAFADKNKVYELTWCHSTTNENWDQELQSGEGFYAHVGSQESALQRQQQEAREGFWVYELGVDSSASLGEDFANDDNSDYYGFFSDISPQGEFPLPHDVSRYVNRYEDRGSISLVINSKKIIVKSKRFVSSETD